MALGTRYIPDVLGVKIIKETTPGTYLSPTTAIYLERGAKPPKVTFQKIENDPMAPTSGTKYEETSPFGATIEYEFTQKMPSDKTKFSTLLEACNFVGTAVTGPDGTSYQLETFATSTISADWISPRQTTKGSGGKGAFTFKGETGKPIEVGYKFNFNYKEETVLAAAADDNTIPFEDVPGLLFIADGNCSSYTINGVSGHFTSFEIDWGAEIQTTEDDVCPMPNYVSSYAPTLKISQKLTEEWEASWDQLTAGATSNIVIGLFDKSGTKKGEIRIPKAMPNDNEPDAKNGRYVTTRTFACRPTNGDDNVQIVMFD